MAAELAELRRITAELAEETAGQGCRSARPATDGSKKLSDIARGMRRASARDSELDVAELTAALGDRALVEILRIDDAMYAVTAVDGRLRFTVWAVTRRIARGESVRFSLHRLAKRQVPRVATAARKGLEYSAAALDATPCSSLFAI